MSVMTAAGVWPPGDRPLSIEDLDRLPEDGNRYELDDGVLIVSPAPANIHQIVVTRLTLVLGAACPPEFMVITGPGVAMSETQYRIPDLAVVRADSIGPAEKSIIKPPALAIEVASPSTALYDRNRKKAVYEQFGVGWYWIVTPDLARPALTAFELRRGSYRQVSQVTGDQPYHAVGPFPVAVVPAALVSGPWGS